MLRRCACSLLLSSITLLGCDGSDAVAPDPTSGAPNAPASFGSGVFISESSIHTLEDNAVVGSSTLIRTRNLVHASARTWNLVPGTVVTLWLTVFNRPENCRGICDADDMQNLSAGPDILYASGAHVGIDGIVRFAGRVGVGATGASINPAFGLPALGVQDPFTSELRLVVRTHGPAIPGLVDEMMRRYGAGCNDTPPALGTRGPNACADIRFARHLAPRGA